MVAVVVLRVALGYFFLLDLLTWVKADAAADFCALVELGFESTLPGYTVGYDGWHAEFDDEEHALAAFAFSLSEDCRLKVVQRGDTDCSWTVKGRNEDGRWREDSTTGLLLIPFWKKRETVYRQNHLISNHGQGGAANPSVPGD